MATLAYPYSVRDSANTTADNRKTGLTPTVSNGKTLAASPATVLASTVAVVEVGAGDYVAIYDAETNLDASFPIDWGSALTNPNDRYGTLILTRDAGRVLAALPNATPAAAGGLLIVGTGSGAINPSAGKVPATLAAGDVAGNLPSAPATGSISSTTFAAGATIPRVTLADTLTANSDKAGYALTAAYDPAKTAAQAGNAMTLTPGERDAIANDLLDLANGVESGETLRQHFRLVRAILAGLAADSGTSFVLKRKDGTTTAVTIAHDSAGNRSAVTIGSL